MDGTVFLEHLRESSLEAGRAHIQNHVGELSDLDATGDLLADEALKQLYNPFLSLKLSELLIFFGDCTHHLPVHALGLKAKGDALVQIKHYQAALEALNAAGAEFLSLGDERNWARSRISWVTAATALGRVEEALQQAHRRLREHSRCRQDHLRGLLPDGPGHRPHLRRAAKRAVPRPRVAQVPLRERRPGVEAHQLMARA